MSSRLQHASCRHVKTAKPRALQRNVAIVTALKPSAANRRLLLPVAVAAAMAIATRCEAAGATALRDRGARHADVKQSTKPPTGAAS
jgi:hypothetical protein